MKNDRDKNNRNSKVRKFDISEEFESKYGFTDIYIKGKTLVLVTYKGKYVYSKYLEDDIPKTIDLLKEEFLNNSDVEIEFTDDLMKDFLYDFGQMLMWKSIGEPSQGEEHDDRSQSERIIDYVKDNASLFFKDDYDTPYARIYNHDHYELIKLTGDKFKRYISRLYYDNEGKVPNIESINNAVLVLRGNTEHRGETFPLSLRVAWDNGDIYYDLTNSKWQCIKATKEGWRLIDSHLLPRPLFKRHNQTAQVIPVREYEPEIKDDFLDLTNVKREDDKILLMCYIISLFVPSIQHVILQLHGMQGSAKSLLERFIKRTVDPAIPELLSVHTDRMEFIQQIAHNYLVFYDNLKHTPNWLSDEVCRAVTGSGSSKRVLYSDDDDVVYEYRRCFGFNGINLVLYESDALDRSINIELESIDPKDRIPEIKMLEKFEALKPRFLGYILDIIVKALTLKQSVEIELKYLPRMGDFAIWGEAIARAMGYEDMKFMNIYNRNMSRQSIETVENNILGHCVSRFISNGRMDESKHWMGFTSKFLEELNAIAYENNIDINSKAWPKDVSSLSRKLRTIIPNIREALGYDITMVRETSGKKKGMSFMEIREMASLPSLPSLRPLSGQSTLKTDSEEGESSEAISEGISGDSKMPSPSSPQDRAQNGVSEASEASEGINPTLPEKDGEDLHKHPQTSPTSPSLSDSSDSGSKYKDMIETQHLDCLNKMAYRCKEHPNSPWYYDLRGIEVSHFEVFHK
jgi:hypothetical protein